MQIHDEIEKSIGEGPPQGPVLDQLGLGKAAVRRRRLATGVAGVAVLAAVSASAYAASLGSPTSAEDGFTGDPTSSPTKPETKPNPNKSAANLNLPVDPKLACPGGPNVCLPAANVPLIAYTHAGKLVRSEGVEVLDRRDGAFAKDADKSAVLRLHFDGKEEWLLVGWTRKGNGVLVGNQAGTTFDKWVSRWERGPVELGLPDDYFTAPASLDTSGRLVLPSATRVLRIVENPAAVTAPEFSLGLDLEYDGEQQWALVEVGSSSWDPAYKSFATLEQWLDDIVALNSGGETQQLVKFGADGALVGLPGVTVVQQRAGVDLGDSFAGPDDKTAVAEVTFEGETWFVPARQIGSGPAEFFPTAAMAGRETLDEFLEYARGQYANGEGLR